jgi:hypothetical protein
MATSDKRIFTAIIVLALLACTAVQAQSTDAGSTPDQAMDAEAAKPEAETAESFESDGMEIPIDGSSLGAFEASLAEIKKHSNEADYTSLENAIGYLLVYDLAARRNREKLAASLDGLTGYEVMEKVGWRKPPPGKSKAEKGAADANLIDT